MKKNRIFILGIVTMFVAILSLTLVSGTLARYTSTGTGTDTVTVAKWDVKYKDVTSGAEFVSVHNNNAISFELFNTIKDEDGSDEDDVIAGKIAPGTSGSFDFQLQNTSDVNATYSVAFTADEKEVPLWWSIDEGNTWHTDISTLNIFNEDIAMTNGVSDTITITWKWLFDNGDDAHDTSLGITPVQPTVGISVTFDQVN